MAKNGRRRKQRAKEKRQAERHGLSIEQWRNRDTGRRSTYDPFKHIAAAREQTDGQ